jgi:hypothetical protein
MKHGLIHEDDDDGDDDNSVLKKNFLKHYSHFSIRIVSCKIFFRIYNYTSYKVLFPCLQWFISYYQHNTENISYIYHIVIFNFMKMALTSA